MKKILCSFLRSSKGLILLVITIYIVATCLLGLVRHWRFESFGYDLGIFDQEVWNYAHLRLPYSTIKIPNMVILGDHFSPSLALLGPLYLFWPGAKFLIVFQAVFMGISALPIYFLGRKILKSKLLAIVITISYLTFFGLQNAVAFDFHEITLATGVLAWLFYFLEEKRLGWYWAGFFVALGMKEDVSLILATLGIYTFLRYRYRKTALITIIISLTWLLFSTKIAIPYFSGSFSHDVRWPKTLPEIAGVFLPGEKWKTVFWSLGSFVFLPIGEIGIMIMAIGHFLIHWIDPRYSGRWETALHYQAPLAPMMAVGAIWTLRNILAKKIISRLTIAGLLLGAIIVSQWQLHLPLNLLLKKDYYQRNSWARETEYLISKIPTNSSVATWNNIVPHLSGRKEIFLIAGEGKTFSLKESPCYPEVNCAWLKYDRTKYVLINLADRQGENNYWGFSREGAEKAIINMVKHGSLVLVEKRGDVSLYQRK